jgi:NTE family protein
MHNHPERHLNHPVLFRVIRKVRFASRGGICACLLALLVSGCASYGQIANKPSTAVAAAHTYSLKTWASAKREGDFTFILAFSGGGTRAAAMAYGVLQELRDTPIIAAGQPARLLDEVDHITSVSGGSFTAAYYGLYGDKIFDNFEHEFLRADIEKHLVESLLNPFHWFGRKERTQRTIEYYQKILFHDATFADMLKPDRPMIVINASDLARGVRFSFIQDYFDFLCSDLMSFPVANAVAASSAVPVVFNPVVVENYADCQGQSFPWPENAAERARHDPEYAILYNGLRSYDDKTRRKYVHFVDGGITDNMGLRAVTDITTLAGGPRSLLSALHKKQPSHVVLISVNASTEGVSDLDESAREPSMLTAMNAVTDVQLHRYNADTLALTESDLAAWAAEFSTPEAPVITHFIQVGFEDVPQPQLKYFLNKIPTSFALTDEQVDALIESARTVLRSEPEFQELLTELKQP